MAGTASTTAREQRRTPSFRCGGEEDQRGRDGVGSGRRAGAQARAFGAAARRTSGGAARRLSARFAAKMDSPRALLPAHRILAAGDDSAPLLQRLLEAVDFHRSTRLRASAVDEGGDDTFLSLH